MDTAEFRKYAMEMVDYICQYTNTVRDRPVTTDVEPGYLRPLVAQEAPQEPESWESIMADFENKIRPGMNQWLHPQFLAYFPGGYSYPSLLGGMLCDSMLSHCFSWAASPACTELETIVLDWLGKAIGLPEAFLSHTKGGGCTQGSASECVLVCMLAARKKTLQRLKEDKSLTSSHCHLSKLVVYCSREAHSCVEKAAMIAHVKIRILTPDANNSLKGETLKQAMEEDEKKGLVPFFVSAILGSTSCCSFDNLEELGPVAREHGCWLHVDAAYAGSSFLCPEFQHLHRGINLANSFNFNPHKWMLTHNECGCMWVTNRNDITSALTVDPLYLKHEHETEVLDYHHWSIPLSRRFRVIKLWCVLRSYGISGLQKHIRNHVNLAKRFEDHVNKDDRFQLMNQVKLGLVCFRLAGEGDEQTVHLLANINHSHKMYMVPARVQGVYVIRFALSYEHTTEEDVDYAWAMISDYASHLLSDPQGHLIQLSSTEELRKSVEKHSFAKVVPRQLFKNFHARLRDYHGPTLLPLLQPGSEESDDQENEDANGQVKEGEEYKMSAGNCHHCVDHIPNNGSQSSEKSQI